MSGIKLFLKKPEVSEKTAKILEEVKEEFVKRGNLFDKESFVIKMDSREMYLLFTDIFANRSGLEWLSVLSGMAIDQGLPIDYIPISKSDYGEKFMNILKDHYERVCIHRFDLYEMNESVQNYLKSKYPLEDLVAHYYLLNPSVDHVGGLLDLGLGQVESIIAKIDQLMDEDAKKFIEKIEHYGRYIEEDVMRYNLSIIMSHQTDGLIILNAGLNSGVLDIANSL